MSPNWCQGSLLPWSVTRAGRDPGGYWWIQRLGTSRCNWWWLCHGFDAFSCQVILCMGGKRNNFCCLQFNFVTLVRELCKSPSWQVTADVQTCLWTWRRLHSGHSNKDPDRHCRTFGQAATSEGRSYKFDWADCGCQNNVTNVRQFRSFVLQLVQLGEASFLVALQSQASSAPVAAPAKGGVGLRFAMVCFEDGGWIFLLKSWRLITVHFTVWNFWYFWTCPEDARHCHFH